MPSLFIRQPPGQGGQVSSSRPQSLKQWDFWDQFGLTPGPSSYKQHLSLCLLSWMASGLKLVWLGQQGLYNLPHFLSPPPLSPARHLPKVAAMGKTRPGDQAGSRS